MNVGFITDFEKDENGRINWKKNLNKKFKVVYEDIEYELYLKSRHGQNLTIEYCGKDYLIYTGNFKKGHLGRILGVCTKEFRVEVGQIFKDNKRNLIIINREYRKTKSNPNQKWYKYHCNKCGNEDWIIEGSLLKNYNCNACCTPPRKAVLGINTIWDKARWMCDLGVSEEDAKKYTYGSGKKITVKCPDCGREKKIEISNIYTSKSISCSCGGSVSYPEKIIMCLLDQIKINYRREYCITYDTSKRYDFYFELNGKKYVIEAHGGQHYDKGFSTIGGRTLQEEQENDRLKKELALNNGIDYYIELDCRESNLEWIRNSVINSELNKIFNLEKVDWLKCEEFALSNRVKEVCDYWHLHNEINNEELTTNDLAKIFNTTKTTVCSYLNKGRKLGWCEYVTIQLTAKRNIDLVKTMLYNGEYNMENLRKEVGVSRETIRDYLKKILSEEEFEKIKKYNLENGLNKKPKYKTTSVLCVNTGEVFNSITEACEKYNIKSSGNLHSCCKGKRSCCGTHPKTGEKLKWKFYNG